MYFIPSFKAVQGKLNIVKINGTSRINNSYDELIEIIKMLLRGIAFDENWYLTKYPDVAAAVSSGLVKSARQHFLDVGYFEGRRPQEFEVDEAWYLANYPDVAEGLGRGEIKSAHQHFNEHGYEEGRLPAPL
jgi:hypothetical protein